MSGEGDIVRKWLPVRNDWASFRILGGGEFFDAQQQQVKVSHRVKMRLPHNADLTADHRLVRIADGKVFQIAFVSGDPGDPEVDLMVVEAR